MLRRLKYALVLLQWKYMFLEKRDHRLIELTAFTVITVLVTIFFIRPSSSLITIKLPSFSNHRFSAPHDCISWKRTPQHKTTLITKSRCPQRYFLLILVSSAPGNIERRNAIRETWGTDHNNIIAQYKTYFLLGQTTNQTHADLLQKENNMYGDLIRAGYYEHYWNQSMKIMMAFEWAARYCNYTFLLKADDDILVNTKSLIQFLQRSSTPRQGLYMGKRHYKPIVQRDGKYKTSYKENNNTHYPDFCSGGGFVMSHDVVECLVPMFDVIKPYRMDDVYVGMLANRTNVTPVNHEGFMIPFGYDVDDCDFIPNTLVHHRAKGQCLHKLFRMHSEDYFFGTQLGSFF